MVSRVRAMMSMLVIGSGAAVLASASVPAAAGTAPAPPAGLLPGPLDFVSGLDLECFATPGPALNLGVTLSHLNPVLQAMGLPAHNVVIRELQQTCVPVMKNGVAPPAAALAAIRHVDLACYRVEAAPLANPVSLQLRHLNPVFANLPLHYVTLIGPSQLCVPVAKNNVDPPPDVIDLVRYIDLECYRVDPITAHPVFGAVLQQLNPQLTGIPAHNMTLGTANRQLCVPVRKNNQLIPPASLDIIRWVDLEKFPASPAVNIAPKAVTLSHLNPLFATLPRVTVTLATANALAVPVAKNGQTPPP
jgi:hypothetical protein